MKEKSTLHKVKKFIITYISYKIFNLHPVMKWVGDNHQVKV